MSEKKSWAERLFGGFKKTSERLSENLTEVVSKAKLDDATLDDVEDALIMSDLGPSAAARIRAKLKEQRFGLELSEAELKQAASPASDPYHWRQRQRQDHHHRQTRKSFPRR